VLGPDCKVLGQWPGITDLGPVAVVLRKALQPVEATEEGEAE